MSRLRGLVSIPTYWHDYVNPSVDLVANPKQPCPFHHEQHGQSFSYSDEKGYWSCFGACHVLGGDVVKMHMLNYKIRNYEQAEESLARLYGIKIGKELTFTKPKVRVDDTEVQRRFLEAKASSLAKSSEDWLELDMIMSQYPPDKGKLEVFINNHVFQE